MKPACAISSQVAMDSCFRNTELKRIWTDVDVRTEASIRVLSMRGAGYP